MANFDETKYIKLDDTVLDSVAGGSGGESSASVCVSCKCRTAYVDTSTGRQIFVCSSCGAKFYYEIDGSIHFCE